ncbi:MAG: AMP-binding protein [Ilumatobacteraceae bacterium]
MSAQHYRQQGWWTDEALWTRYSRHAASHPTHLAVADDRGVELTHAGLADAAARLAGRLTDAGVTSGDLILVIMPNRAEWQVVFAALLRLGAIPMTVPVTTDGATLTYLCNLTEVTAIVTATRLANIPLGETAAEAAAKADRSTAVVIVDDVATIDMVRAGSREPRTLALGDTAHVMTTSSTTGKPKAVTHSENTLAALNVGFANRFALDATTPIFMASPLGHSVGAIHGARLSMFLGAPLILQERWDPEQALDIIDRYRCDFTSAATPFLKDLIDTPARGPKLASMRTFLCGGAAVPPLLMDQADEQFTSTFVSVLWGMTEGGVTTSTLDSTADQRRNTAGCGLPGLEMSTVDETLQHLPTGEAGELVMRGPGVFTGYLGQDDLYESLLTPDGYFRTGDLARLDADGYLHLTGRLKDLIIRGGVNISPVAIEDTLAGHPHVRRVAVIGEPDERLGERLCAVVVPKGDATVSLDELLEWSSDQGLPRRYWPESMRVVDEMPVTAAGKIRKNQLRDELFGSAS